MLYVAPATGGFVCVPALQMNTGIAQVVCAAPMVAMAVADTDAFATVTPGTMSSAWMNQLTMPVCDVMHFTYLIDDGEVIALFG